MKQMPEGVAIVYAQGAYNTPNGKTAHGLVRFTKRYQVRAVVDSRYAGRDAGEVLDGKANGIAIHGDVAAAHQTLKREKSPATHFVMGLAPDGGRLDARARQDVRTAIELGLHIDSGLHDFISDDADMAALAASQGVRIRDIRKTPPRDRLHFFSGKIEKVTSLKVALLGTDSAVGKRTTAWILVHALAEAGYSAELIGTGQTAWMQGARYSFVMDSLINDFVAGEMEHAVWSAWHDQHPDVIVIEGQGSLMNPAYPGGYEILAAGRPDVVIMQHAPARVEYDGFPGYPLHPLSKQIQAVEMISGKPVVAVTINHEELKKEDLPGVIAAIHQETGLPALDPLWQGGAGLVPILLPHLQGRRGLS